jgi:uncharacterized iron-regulated membrane protein
MKIKSVLGQIHLWIGLPLGLLFFIVAFSGALYTWMPEFARIIYKEKVAIQDAPIVAPSILKATLDREFPSGDFRTAYYRGRNTSMQVLLYGNGTYYHASMDPYTGELIHLQDMNTGWLNYLKFLHRNLILGDVGRKIVHWVTLLFLIMIITGLVLWWPVNKRGRKQRLTIKWGAFPKKLNYDLHNVLGFYATWVLIFMVLTGIFWGFEVVREGLRSVTGETAITYEKPVSVVPAGAEGNDPFPLIDRIMYDFRQRYPDKNIRVSNPHQADEPINVAVIDRSTAGYLTDHFHIDRYTGKVLDGHFENGLHAEASTFHTLHMLVYDVHFGTVWGLPGRLLVFFASLIGASLPITGFLLWWGKRRSGK